MASTETKPDPGGADTETITLRVKDQTGEETFFKVKKTTKMVRAPSLARSCDGPRLKRAVLTAYLIVPLSPSLQDKVFNAYAQRKGVDKQALRFLVDGERVQGDATPKSVCGTVLSFAYAVPHNLSAQPFHFPSLNRPPPLIRLVSRAA